MLFMNLAWFLKSHPCYFRLHPNYYDAPPHFTEAISGLWNDFSSISVALTLPVFHLDSGPKPIWMCDWHRDSSIWGMVALIFMVLKIILILVIWKGRRIYSSSLDKFIKFEEIFQRRLHHSHFIFQKNRNNPPVTIWYLKL